MNVQVLKTLCQLDIVELYLKYTCTICANKCYVRVCCVSAGRLRLVRMYIFLSLTSTHLLVHLYIINFYAPTSLHHQLQRAYIFASSTSTRLHLCIINFYAPTSLHQLLRAYIFLLYDRFKILYILKKVIDFVV